MAAIVGESKEKARIFADGMAAPDKLTKDEYLQFAYLGISLFRRYENVYFQYQSGMINDDFWFGHRENLLWFFHRPGTQVWWQERRIGFSRSFRDFLESTSPTGGYLPTTPPGLGPRRSLKVVRRRPRQREFVRKRGGSALPVPPKASLASKGWLLPYKGPQTGASSAAVQV